MVSQVDVAIRPLDLVCLRFDADAEQTFLVGVFGDVSISHVLEVVDQLVRQHCFDLLIRECRTDPHSVGFVEIEEARHGAVTKWIVRTFYDRELAGRYQLGNREYSGHIEIAKTEDAIHYTRH